MDLLSIKRSHSKVVFGRSEPPSITKAFGKHKVLMKAKTHTRDPQTWGHSTNLRNSKKSPYSQSLKVQKKNFNSIQTKRSSLSTFIQTQRASFGEPKLFLAFKCFPNLLVFVPNIPLYSLWHDQNMNSRTSDL